MKEFERRFVQPFGEMGGRWGINRTVGQVHALLCLAQRPQVVLLDPRRRLGDLPHAGGREA